VSPAEEEKSANMLANEAAAAAGDCQAPLDAQTVMAPVKICMEP